MKPFVASFTVPIYKSRVYICVAKNTHAIYPILPAWCKSAINPSDNDYDGLFFDNNEGRFVLALFSLTRSVIAHEIRHLERYIMHYHQVRQDDEACAYLNGELHSRVCGILDRHGCRIKRK